MLFCSNSDLRVSLWWYSQACVWFGRLIFNYSFLERKKIVTIKYSDQKQCLCKAVGETRGLWSMVFILSTIALMVLCFERGNWYECFHVKELQMQNRYKIIREPFLRSVLWFVKKTFSGPSLSLQLQQRYFEFHPSLLWSEQRREVSGKETILGLARAMLGRQKAFFTWLSVFYDVCNDGEGGVPWLCGDCLLKLLLVARLYSAVILSGFLKACTFD